MSLPVPLPMPRLLVEHAARGTTVGFAEFVEALPDLVDGAVRHWRLRVGEPYQPGGMCSWVAPAQDAAGRDVVLKVGFPDADSASEAEGLRLWAGRGTVLLHGVLDLPVTGTARTCRALLLERCGPGTTLGATFAGASEPEQDVVVAGLLRRLWDVRLPSRPASNVVSNVVSGATSDVSSSGSVGVSTLTAMCTRWAAAFREDHARAAAAGEPVLGADLVEEGLAAYLALPVSAPDARLLVTDLHAANVLAAQREPWLVIDPKPFVGDPAYDVTQHLMNCEERLLADPVGLCARMAALCDLDTERVVRWLFARSVVESFDLPVAAPGRGLAARLRGA